MRWSSPRRTGPRSEGRRGFFGRFERALFSVMGPPQLGDLSAPVRVVAAQPVDICATCGQPRDDHTVVRGARLTYTQCPGINPAPPADS